AEETLTRIEQALAVLERTTKATPAEAVARIMAGGMLGPGPRGEEAFFDPFGQAVAIATLRNYQGVLLGKEFRKLPEAVTALEAGLKAAAACPESGARDPLLAEIRAQIGLNLAHVHNSLNRLAAAWEALERAEREFGPVAKAYPDRLEEKGLLEQIER